MPAQSLGPPPLDGDTVLAAATGVKALADPYVGLAQLGGLAASILARAKCGCTKRQRCRSAGALPAWDKDKYRCWHPRGAAKQRARIKRMDMLYLFRRRGAAPATMESVVTKPLRRDRAQDR